MALLRLAPESIFFCNIRAKSSELMDNRDISSSSEILQGFACNHLDTKRDALTEGDGEGWVVIID